MPPRRILVALGLVLATAACVPVRPPAAPPAPPAPAAPAAPSLPAAPVGGEALAAYVDTNPDPDPSPSGRTWANPDAPDPFVLSVNPTWCDHGAGPPPACYYTYTTQVLFNIAPVYRSTDLVSWEVAGFNGTIDTGASRSSIAPWSKLIGHWAPAVLERPASPAAPFVMWYAAESQAAGTVGLHCLGVATAISPNGPFADNAAAPAYCQPAERGTIDPSPFVDSDGTAYLTYKSEGTAFIPTRIYISQLAADGQSLVPGTEHLLLETNNAPGSWEPPIIEGPTMARTPGGLFVFYSANRWQAGNYRVGVARCNTPAGPCSRVYSTAVVASRGAMQGPGGQTPVLDSAGNWRLLFHSWTAPNIGYPAFGARSLHILPLTFPGGSPLVG